MSATELATLGDVHLGKKFRTGVPFDRIGEREELVWKQFEVELMSCTAKVHVQMGDLFNEFAVPEAVVLRAANLYRVAAVMNSGTTYVIIRGNHDAARDADKKSSFDVFKELLKGVKNVHVLTEVDRFLNYGFLPWHPFKSSTELAMDLKSLPGMAGAELDAVFCHCDIQSFGGDDVNLIPINVLKHFTKKVYTGHIHLPQTFEQEGVTVVVTGSMQPYAHGEDAHSFWYKTLPFEEVATLDPKIRNMNYRVLIKDGDVVPQLDCLSLITKRVAEDEEERETVELDSFDMTALFRQALEENKVGKIVMDKILTQFLEKKNA